MSKRSLRLHFLKGLVRRRQGKPGVDEAGLFEVSGDLREWTVVGAVILHVGSSLMASEKPLSRQAYAIQRGGTRNLAAEDLPGEGPP